MQTGELRGKVGVAPGTTTIHLPGSQCPLVLGQNEPLPAMTEDEYRHADIQVRKREVFWAGFAAFGTSTLSMLALIGVFAAFVRTGKLQTPAPR
jgi:hypothetical protein